MTNVKLFRNGQRCNSVNYWVTRVQARPGRGQWSGHWWGLARGWHRPMGWPEWEDGWGARSWLVRLVAGWVRQRLCNPAAVSCVLWRVSPLTHSVSDSRNSQPRTRGHRALSDRARRGEGPVPRVTVTGAGPEQPRADGCESWELCQQSEHNCLKWVSTPRTQSRELCQLHTQAAALGQTRHEPSASSCVITDIKRTLSPRVRVSSWPVPVSLPWAVSSDMWGCRGAPPSLSSVLRPPGEEGVKIAGWGSYGPHPAVPGAAVHSAAMKFHEGVSGGGGVMAGYHHHNLMDMYPGPAINTMDWKNTSQVRQQRRNWWRVLNDATWQKGSLLFCDNHAN